MKKHIIYGSLYASWSIIGFKRGIDDYDYSYNKKQFDKNNTYLYSSKIGLGLCGLILYMNPFLIPLFMSKEIYRLEVNMRGLEKDKKSDFYNRLLL